MLEAISREPSLGYWPRIKSALHLCHRYAMKSIHPRIYHLIRTIPRVHDASWMNDKWSYLIYLRIIVVIVINDRQCSFFERRWASVRVRWEPQFRWVQLRWIVYSLLSVTCMTIAYVCSRTCCTPAWITSHHTTCQLSYNILYMYVCYCNITYIPIVVVYTYAENRKTPLQESVLRWKSQ